METQHPPFQIKSHMIKGFYGVRDKNLFNTAIQTAVNQLNTGGVYIGDNMFVFSRNLGFLRDEKFMQIFQDNVTTGNEQAALWRYYTLSWAAKRVLSLNIPGDFVECACYRGTSARILCDYLDFGASGRNYYLYDMFNQSDDDGHMKLAAHSEELYDTVCQRFADLDNVHVTKGRVPQILHEVAPETISFMHIHLNAAEPELGALKLLFERLSPGGLLVLDDYGWLAYWEQKAAEDPFFESLGYQVLELPTGQGLIIK